MIVYRVLKRSPERRLLVKDISVHFPDQNDMQNRQRLKEFMEYQRSGDDQGYWKLKEELPNDRLISPEDLTLLESMQVGQQQLDDKEFYTNEEMNDELAIWNLTKNFISATQGKAMLQINGDADGKSFSFLKTSMKGGFKSFESNGHSYNVALQQKAYDEEISRTWYDQQKRLSNPSPPTLEEVIAKNTSIPDLPNDQPKKVAETGDAPKFLKITRRVRDKNGMIQRKYEIIRDPAVIKAYIKRREKLEEDIIPEEVKVTNDEEKNQKTKKLLEEQLAKLQKNQERRNARKANKESQLGKGSGKGKSTSRRCATCGAIGHIRTNKACPMYDEGNP
jgi:transcription initiation factor TFIID subunit 1